MNKEEDRKESFISQWHNLIENLNTKYGANQKLFILNLFDFIVQKILYDNTFEERSLVAESLKWRITKLKNKVEEDIEDE